MPDRPQGAICVPRVVVAQLGSRMHYAVPLAFHRAGMLTRLITDVTADARMARLAAMLPARLEPRLLRRLKGRLPSDLPPRLVRQFPGFGLWIGLLRKIAARRGRVDGAYLWIGRSFARRAAQSIPAGTTVIYGFNGASLELLRAPIANKALKILEQTMAPRLVEDRLLRSAFETFPQWVEEKTAKGGFQRPELYQREAAEWDAADVILCGSRFVVDGIAEAGGPVEKCVVTPYGIDLERFPGRPRKISCNRPLRVLFVGAVSLRKGAPLALEVARLLGSEATIRMVGAIQVPAIAERALRDHVDLLGSVPRTEIEEHFAWADIFLLPSYCEGSATVTYEAMASGLPQIVTSSSGSYVVNNREGLVVPPGDAAALAAAVRYYAANPTAYERASLAALKSVRNLTLERYQERLVSLAKTHLAKVQEGICTRP